MLESKFQESTINSSQDPNIQEIDHRELLSLIKDPEFNPEQEISKHFKFNFNNNEDELIESLLGKIDQQEKCILACEKQIMMDEDTLNMERKITQVNSDEDIKSLVFNFTSLKEKISEMKDSVYVE